MYRAERAVVAHVPIPERQARVTVQVPDQIFTWFTQKIVYD